MDMRRHPIVAHDGGGHNKLKVHGSSSREQRASTSLAKGCNLRGSSDFLARRIGNRTILR